MIPATLLEPPEGFKRTGCDNNVHGGNTTFLAVSDSAIAARIECLGTNEGMEIYL